MNRIATIALVAFATGCAGDGVSLQLEGEIFNAARGVAIADDGERVHMGMEWGTTCAFDVDGTFQQDFDFPTETDAIHDARFGAAVGTSTEGVHFIGRGMADVALSGVAAAALTEDGAIALSESGGACHVDFIDGGGQTHGVTLGDACGPQELSTIDGLALVGAETGAALLDRDGNVTTLAGADQIAANRSAGQVYTATTDESVLYASSLDGTSLWQTDLGGRLADVADMGAAGLVVASVSRDGRGAVLFLDATSGEVIDEVEVPSAQQLATSDNGETLALVGEWETRVYGVDRDRGGLNLYTSARDAGLQSQPMGD